MAFSDACRNEFNKEIAISQPHQPANRPNNKPGQGGRSTNAPGRPSSGRSFGNGSRSGGGRSWKKKPEEESQEDHIELEGVISSVLAGTMFKVKLPNGHEVLAHISGKMRKRFIRLVVGDKVRMEMSPYDTSKARITFRIG